MCIRDRQCTCNDDNYMVHVKLENIDNNAKIIDFNDPTTWHLTNSVTISLIKIW